MIKRVFVASAVVLASLAAPAAAGPSWTALGKAQLPSYGNAQIFIDRSSASPPGMMAGQLHAVLDEPWMDPNASGSYRDIYFRVLANCRAGTFALQPTWPVGPDEMSIHQRDLRRPVPGSAEDRLMRAVCG